MSAGRTVLHKCYLLDDAEAANALYYGRPTGREHWCTIGPGPHTTDEMRPVVTELGINGWG